jgi:hypothetical protein
LDQGKSWLSSLFCHCSLSRGGATCWASRLLDATCFCLTVGVFSRLKVPLLRIRPCVGVPVLADRRWMEVDSPSKPASLLFQKALSERSLACGDICLARADGGRPDEKVATKLSLPTTIVDHEITWLRSANGGCQIAHGGLVSAGEA